MTRLTEGRPVRAALAALGLVGLSSIGLLWGWNALAASWPVLPHASFKHAVALQAVIAGVGVPSLFIASACRRRTGAARDA